MGADGEGAAGLGVLLQPASTRSAKAPARVDNLFMPISFLLEPLPFGDKTKTITNANVNTVAAFEIPIGIKKLQLRIVVAVPIV
jgi:hypothetical protein